MEAKGSAGSINHPFPLLCLFSLPPAPLRVGLCTSTLCLPLMRGAAAVQGCLAWPPQPSLLRR